MHIKLGMKWHIESELESLLNKVCERPKVFSLAIHQQILYEKSCNKRMGGKTQLAPISKSRFQILNTASF
jgi:hypothetical protein